MLVLGGTGEARDLATKLAARADVALSVSLAGRTRNPLDLPGDVRSGGFGGAEGLAAHLRAARIDALIDATHPFAAAISANAARAAERVSVPLIALARPPWTPQPGDRWTPAADIPDAVTCLGKAPRRVLVALGRNEVRALEAAPQHHYLVRSIDPVEPPLAVPDARYITARGPFTREDERALLLAHRIDVVLSKNSGGAATYGKIEAARELGLEVVMVERPPRPKVETAGSVAQVIVWLERLVHQRPPLRRGV